MEAWLKQHLLSLLVLVGSLIGVYTSLQSNQAADRADIVELQLHVKKLDTVYDSLPALEKDVEYLKEEVNELKPIMSDLAQGVNNLNVTLAKLEGKLEASDSKK